MMHAQSWFDYSRRKAGEEAGTTQRGPCLDAAVVDEAVVHLEEGLLAGLVGVEAEEGVVERVARLPVADDVARGDVAEAAEDDLQVLFRRQQQTCERRALPGNPAITSAAANTYSSAIAVEPCALSSAAAARMRALCMHMCLCACVQRGGAR